MIIECPSSSTANPDSVVVTVNSIEATREDHNVELVNSTVCDEESCWRDRRDWRFLGIDDQDVLLVKSFITTSVAR